MTLASPRRPLLSARPTAPPARQTNRPDAADLDAMTRPTLLFLHIPKTAGSTMRALINRKYASHRTLLLSGPNLPRMQAALDQFRAATQGERDHWDCLYGHFLFGVHEFLTRPYFYFTLLRDPIERCVSHYHEMQREVDQWGNQEVAKDGGTLWDFVDWQERNEMDNMQTRFLLGPDRWENIAEFRPLTEADLAKAKSHLRDQVAVVGTQERFDETLLLLKEKAGWASCHYGSARISKNRKQVREIDEVTLEKIRGINRFDIELWKYADELLTEAIGARAAEFAQKVQRFRDQNRTYQHFLPGVMLFDRVKKSIRWRLGLPI